MTLSSFYVFWGFCVLYCFQHGLVLAPFVFVSVGVNEASGETRVNIVSKIENVSNIRGDTHILWELTVGQ